MIKNLMIIKAEIEKEKGKRDLVILEQTTQRGQKRTDDLILIPLTSLKQLIARAEQKGKARLEFSYSDLMSHEIELINKINNNNKVSLK